MRILGLDIGSTSVKAVEVDAAFGRFQVHEYHEIHVTGSSTPMEVAGQLIRSLPKAPDKLVTPLKSSRITFRNLKIPTRDKKAIQSAIQFELEDDLPFEPDQIVSDYAPMGVIDGESHVHVTAAMKKTLEDYFGIATPSGMDPDALTTEACAYRALLRKTIPDEQRTKGAPIMIAHLGHERTTLYVQSSDLPVVCREAPWGSREINLALSKKYNLSIEAAEKTKIDNGFVLPLSQVDDVSHEQREFSSTVYEAILPLIQAIKQADLACKNATQHRPGLIFVTGGPSLLPGLTAVIAEELKIPTQPLRALSSVSGSGVTYSDPTDAKHALALGAALAFLGSEKPFLINFRKGEFSRTGKSRDFDLTRFKKPLRTLAIGAIFLIAILGAQNFLFEQKIKDTNAQLEKSIKSFFGSISSSTLRSYVANTSSLKRNIEAELNKERELMKLLTPDPNSPFEFMRDISAGIPKDVVTDLMKFQVGSSSTSPDGSISLEFWVSNPQIAERLATLLSPKIKDMSRSELAEVKGADGTKRWKLVLSGKTQEGGSHGR